MPAPGSCFDRIRSLAVAAAAVAAVMAVGGCSPAPSLLSDPREILDRAAANLVDAKTVHLAATVDGTLTVGGLIPGLPGGTGGSGVGPLSLTGTRVDGDLDLGGRGASLRLQVPALLGLTAEVREVGGLTFVTSSLTGKGWRRLDASSLPAVGDWRPTTWIDGLRTWLREPGVVPTRLDDASCATGTCYGVRLVVDGPLPVSAAAGSSFGLDVRLERLTLDLWIDRVSLRLSRLGISADLGQAGSVQATIDLTAWDAGVTIAAPPSGEVTSGPLLP